MPPVLQAMEKNNGEEMGDVESEAVRGRGTGVGMFAVLVGLVRMVVLLG